MPEDPAQYSQNRAADDIAAVLGHLGIGRAHVVGLSMSGMFFNGYPGGSGLTSGAVFGRRAAAGRRVRPAVQVA